MFVLVMVVLLYGALHFPITIADTSKKQKVILISLDGFRWDFREKANTPNLDEIVKETGVSVDYVQNVFPTTTTPNHYSIVTGLYPENHGLIDNQMFNRSNGDVFTLSESKSEWWNQATPIWITNEEEGYKSCAFFWPGYDKSYGGRKATYLPPKKVLAPYETTGKKSMSLHERIDKIVEWLKKDSNLTFVAMYCEEPDETVHNASPDSKNKTREHLVKESLQVVDKMVGYLLRKIQDANLTDTTNIIMIGDHGHINTTHKKQFNMDDFVDTKKNARYITGFTDVFIYAKKGRAKFIYDKLKNASRHVQVYLKEDIPEHFHVKNNSRTGDILLLPESGWVIVNNMSRVDFLQKDFSRGEHGYSNLLREMNPGFFAVGPAFRHGFRGKCIKTVDVYPLMCEILGIKPLRYDGRLERVKDFLKDEARSRHKEERIAGITTENDYC